MSPGNSKNKNRNKESLKRRKMRNRKNKGPLAFLDNIPVFCKRPIIVLFICIAVLAGFARNSARAEAVFVFEDQGCTSDQQCHDLALLSNAANVPLSPFCWKDHTCNQVRQFAMTTARGDNGSILKTPPGSLGPVFQEGDEMCVIVMISPDITHINGIWNSAGAREDSTRETIQQRLVQFEKIPFELTLESLWLCSSMSPRDSSGAWDIHNFNTIANSYIKPFDQENPDSTGCSTKNSHVQSFLVYQKHDKIARLGAKVYPSKTGLMSKICLHSRALGDPRVPMYMQAKVSIQPKNTIGPNDTFYAMARAFGLNLEKHEKETSEQECVEIPVEPTHKARSHGNRNKHKKSASPKTVHSCSKSKRVEKHALFTVTSSDIILGEIPSMLTGKQVGVQEVLQHEEGDDSALVLFEEDDTESEDDSALNRLLGYYYYHDPAYGYYYHHPHVHCHWDLDFDQGAGICEVPGAKISDSGHVFMLFMVTLSAIVVITFFFMVDWKSRVLFDR